MSDSGSYPKIKTFLVFLGIVLLTSLFMLPYLGSVHLFDTDEVNYAESSREMILTGDYMNVQIDFHPFPEKPPLFFWLQAASMKVFGINEFAARFPNVLCSMITFMLLYIFGRRIYGHRFGLFWIFSFGAAILPFFFFKSGIIDPWYNLFLFLGIAMFVFYLDPERLNVRTRNVALSAFFIGLAVLTKGPVAILIFAICLITFLSLKRFKLNIRFKDGILFIVILLLVGGSWYYHQLLSGNGYVLRDFFRHSLKLLSEEISGHGGFIGYHLVILLLGVFPASVLAMKSITKKSEDTDLQRLFKQWMYIMIIVVLVLYSIPRTKLLHYSSLAYFPLTFLSTWVWEKWVDRKIEIGIWQVILIFLVTLFYSGATILFPLLTEQQEWLGSRDLSFINEFTRQALTKDVHWSGYEWLVGLFLLVGVLFSLIQILRRNARGMLILHIVVLLFVTSTVYLFSWRVEGYTQRAAINFYKGLKGQEVYVHPLGFKSYSHLFYFDKQPDDPSLSVREIMENDIDRDAFFVIRIDEKDKYLERYPQLEVIQERDGFVFTVKRAKPIDQ